MSSLEDRHHDGTWIVHYPESQIMSHIEREKMNGNCVGGNGLGLK